MALPQTEAELRDMVERVLAYGSAAYELRPINLFRDDGPPKLRSLPYQLWCAIRGHGGITHLPGPVFYMRDGLCKRCGARVCS